MALLTLPVPAFERPVGPCILRCGVQTVGSVEKTATTATRPLLLARLVLFMNQGLPLEGLWRPLEPAESLRYLSRKVATVGLRIPYRLDYLYTCTTVLLR